VAEKASAGPTIGVFDSGVGGLSVLSEIRRALPGAELLYVADSGHAPYGERDPGFITERVLAIAAFFRTHDVDAIVVACNTASAVALPALRARFTRPVVAIEPAIKPAVQRTRSGVVGVLATSRTVASDGVARLVNEHGRGVRVLLQACPGLVEQVERGELDNARTGALVERFVRPLLDEGADTLVLGCTHYPFLRALIERVAGPGVDVIDPAPAVARELVRRLAVEPRIELRAAHPAPHPGSERFWTSGPLAQASALIPTLWGRAAQVLALPHAYGSRAPHPPHTPH
jgi:glutamate racemase